MLRFIVLAGWLSTGWVSQCVPWVATSCSAQRADMYGSCGVAPLLLWPGFLSRCKIRPENLEWRRIRCCGIVHPRRMVGGRRGSQSQRESAICARERVQRCERLDPTGHRARLSPPVSMAGRGRGERRSSSLPRSRSPSRSRQLPTAASLSRLAAALASRVPGGVLPRAGERPPDEPSAVYVGVNDAAISLSFIVRGARGQAPRFFTGSRPWVRGDMMSEMMRLQELPLESSGARATGTGAPRALPTGIGRMGPESTGGV